jgi:uncharacterized protein YjbI with pentapeptide repeats
LEFIGYYLPEISFHRQFTKALYLIEVTFYGKAKFNKAEFFEINFRGATFSKGALFYRATFSGGVNFISAMFSEADFRYAQFLGLSRFYDIFFILE